LIASLSGHEFIDLSEDFDLEYVARGLFEAPPRLGRVGNLINVVAMLDVYFAGDRRLSLGLCWRAMTDFVCPKRTCSSKRSRSLHRPSCRDRKGASGLDRTVQDRAEHRCAEWRTDAGSLNWW
jgi:hypothetical protein